MWCNRVGNMPRLSPQRQEVALVMRTVEVGTNHCLTYSTHKISQQNRKRNGTQKGINKRQSEGIGSHLSGQPWTPQSQGIGQEGALLVDPRGQQQTAHLEPCFFPSGSFSGIPPCWALKTHAPCCHARVEELPSEGTQQQKCRGAPGHMLLLFLPVWIPVCPGRGHSNPLPYPCLENPIDRAGYSPLGHRESDMTEAT